MITEIELLLREIEGLKDNELDNKRNEYVRKVIQLEELSPSNYSPQVLFSLTNSPQQKKRICVYLLRLICHNEYAVWEDHEFRVKTFTLFDEHMTDVYSSLKIKSSDGNHIKLAALKNIEQEILKSFKEITSSISDLETSVSLQSIFMKSLNSSICKTFLDIFVKSSLTLEGRIKQLFGGLKSYDSSSEISRIEIYYSVNNVFTEYIKDAENDSSIFTRTCLIEPFKKIHELIRDDFGKTDTIKSAKVNLYHPGRKYPFHKTGDPIELKFILENEGLGYAFDVQIEVLDAEGLQLQFDSTFDCGEVKVEKLPIILCVTILACSNKKPGLFVRWSWRNYDKTRFSEDNVFEFDSQRPDINWDELKLRRPYSLQAVDTEEELIGRGNQVQAIYANLIADKVESTMIFGQKRVGKTSIARTLANKLNKEANLIPLYIKVGDLDKTSPSHCVRTLGDAIVEETSYSDEISKLAIDKPVFNEVLSPPLAKYFRKIKALAPNLRFIIIIDEFDEIPSGLYRYTDIGNTFFHNIRSLSQEGTQIGFILVGGENMQIIRQSTDRLNLFIPFKVDYFAKVKFFGDFQELIRHPLYNIFEFSDESINEIYESTEGNPFYTKFICDILFKRACDKKNSYISIDETKEAIIDAIESLDTINVNHFWIDGVWEDHVEKHDHIQTQRRKFLIAYAEIKRCKGRVKVQDIYESKILSDVAVDSMTESFINREILLEENGYLRLKPRLFDEWLIQKGSQLLTSSFSDANAIEELKNKEEKAYVTDREIVALTNTWGLYRNSQITPPHVRTWLNQFEDNLERRLMMKLLQNITFYSEKCIREKLVVIHAFVRRNMTVSIKEGEKRTREILLSSFGQPTKSSSSYARMYASENKIILANVASIDEIANSISKNERISTLLFIDDIIASGSSIIDSLKTLNKLAGAAIVARDLKVVVATICGLESGREAIERESLNLPFKVEVFICDILDDSNRCFTESSSLFESKLERNKAKEIAYKYGIKLQKKIPLGYEEGQLLIVFPDTCPNNSLPILWYSSSSSWFPLFRRH
jgi:hypothetical protein